MDISVLALIGISIFAMFFGYFFGLFEGRGQGYKRRKKEEAELGVPRAAPATPAPTPSEAVHVEKPALLSVTHDETGQPRLELDGRPVDTTKMNPEQRKRLVELMVMMRPWVEGTVSQTRGPSMGSSAAAGTLSAAERFRKATGANEAVSLRPEKVALGGGPANVTSPLPSMDKPITNPLSMVAQIDAILQGRLLGTPLAERGVHLMDAPNGGVAVFVGLDRYSAVGDVPDPEVRAAIRAAIAQWEEKFTPS